jgi:cysteine synthase A
MLPDTGERYLSTPLFDGIGVDMDDEEIELSRSTPGSRFDVPAPAPAPAAHKLTEVVAAAAPAHDADAEAYTDGVIRDTPVVMFALEWCEFCWSVRKLFAHLGIAMHSVDLDSVALQADNLGTRLRPVLKRRSGAPTIPQIWIGGTHIGGATDLFDAWREGRAQRLLGAAGVPFDAAAAAAVDPAAFLPRWLHPRAAA